MTAPAKTIRHRILLALEAQLKATTWVQAPFSVYLGRAAFSLERHPLPILTILALPEESEATRYGTDRNTMPVQVVGLLAYDASLEDDDPEADLTAMAEPVKGEIQQAATNPGEALAELVDSIQYTGGGLQDYPDSQGQTVVQVTINLAVIYSTVKGDPYNATPVTGAGYQTSYGQ